MAVSDARREACWLMLVLAAASVPLVASGSTISAAAALYSLGDGAHPFWVLSDAWLLYVRVPLVTISTLAVLLAPGLLLASALGATRSWSWWILCALGLSITVLSTVTAIIQAIVGTPLVGRDFLLVILGCTVVAAVAALVRAGRKQRHSVPPDAARNAIECAAAIAVILVALLPKFFWENFNGDGADALEVARLLLHHVLPFWPSGSGTIGAFPGMTSMLFAYPASWFVRLFGALEFSARATMLLALVGAHAGIVALAEFRSRDDRRSDRTLHVRERLLIWGALLAYTIVIAYSATYSPYSADIAMPGAQDTLFVAMFMATCVAFGASDLGWMSLFGLLSYVALPSGLLLLGMLGVAALAAYRPIPRRMIGGLVVLVAVCIVTGAGAPHILRAIGSPAPGTEYASSHLAKRLMMVQFTDWRRLLYVVVPCGIAPAAAIFMWRRQDPFARTIALLSVGYFLFTYLQAYSKLHYYVPVMLLPIALYWRIAPAEPAERMEWRVAALAGLCGALVLAMPARAAPFTTIRQLASRMQIRVPGYDRSASAAFLASDAVTMLFPMDWDRRVPGILGSSPLAFNYYLRHDLGDPVEGTDYVIQPDTTAIPLGFHSIGTREGFTVLVRSDSVLAQDRARRLPSDPGNPVFRIAHGVLFNYATSTNGAPVHDIGDALARRGIKLGGIPNHTGVTHQ